MRREWLLLRVPPLEGASIQIDLRYEIAFSHPYGVDDVRGAARAADDLDHAYAAVHPLHDDGDDGDDHARHVHAYGCDAPHRDGHTRDQMR